MTRAKFHPGKISSESLLNIPLIRHMLEDDRIVLCERRPDQKNPNAPGIKKAPNTFYPFFFFQIMNPTTATPMMM